MSEYEEHLIDVASYENYCLAELFEELEEYFDGMADAEYFPDRAQAVPNKEMEFLVKVQEMRTKYSGGKG